MVHDFSSPRSCRSCHSRRRNAGSAHQFFLTATIILVLACHAAVPVIVGDTAAVPETYEPTWESLEKHPVPDWYRDAKFGIFIHWGVYSVPGWAPKGKYAEWYPRNMYKKGSPTWKYHVKHYGDPSQFTYNRFIPMFTADKWDPERWTDLFVAAGARYVVPVGEHHDGFAMWDSDLTEWDAADKGPKRDIIGELGRSCRKRKLKYAPSYHRMMNYYDPAYDNGAFSHPHYSPKGPDKVFVAEWKKRWEELRDKYRPDILWFDGDWKGPVELWGTKQIVADYYNEAKTWGVEVLVNDRLGKVRGTRGDFYTQEYHHGIRSPDIIPQTWESCRGIGASFGYNRQEGPNDYQPTGKLVRMLVDIVSKNGNLLLDIGPKADGTIPAIQRERLLGMGAWLKINGDAIYGTRPWKLYGEGKTVRFTRKKNTVYAVLFTWPGARAVIAAMAKGSKHLPEEIDAVRMLGAAGALEWTRGGDGLAVDLPSTKPCAHAWTLAVTLK